MKENYIIHYTIYYSRERLLVVDVVFSAKISKMGDNRIIWIPKSFAEMIKPWEDERVLVKICSTNTKVTQVEGGKYEDKE